MFSIQNNMEFKTADEVPGYIYRKDIMFFIASEVVSKMLTCFFTLFYIQI